MAKHKSTGRRCSICNEPINQNERLFTDGKSVAHNHGRHDWKEVR